MAEFARLYTKQGEKGGLWNEYPRPMLKRSSFLNLNGEWDFTVNNGGEPEVYDRKINVPFCPESLLSGINEVFGEDKTLWYRRRFILPDGFLNDRLLLHFGAVDQICEVFVNGKRVGGHRGGYEAFCFDITGCLERENTLTVRVKDNLSDRVLPYGKQCKKRGGMWYTPVSGIWQTVWLESVPENYIKGIKINVTARYAEIEFDGIGGGEVTLGDNTYKIVNWVCRVEPENPQCWSPENPHLYYFTAKAGKDTVESYFALRELSIKTVNGKSRMCLNGRPYFFNGILDQGYWSDGLFTPASPQCYAEDIAYLKELGFNMLRKHIKVEPEIFYFECDRLGIAVFQDMVNNGEYSFLRDTALPTVGVLRKNDKRTHKSPDARRAFTEGMESTVKQLYSHPSVCQWTVFNEGWGQFCADDMYDRLRELDGTRFIDSASGWFVPKKTDLCSRHIYFRRLKAIKTDKPYFISEFGGYAYAAKGHVFNPERAFGYANCKTRVEFVEKLRNLYKTEVLPLVEKGLSGAVYTQVSDVEDEINGLLTYDRRVQKIKPEEFRDIAEDLFFRD